MIYPTILPKASAQKVIDRLSKVRKVNTDLAWQIYEKHFSSKSYQVPYMSTLCDIFASELWNKGAIS